MRSTQTLVKIYNNYELESKKKIEEKTVHQIKKLQELLEREEVFFLGIQNAF